MKKNIILKSILIVIAVFGSWNMVYAQSSVSVLNGCLQDNEVSLSGWSSSSNISPTEYYNKILSSFDCIVGGIGRSESGPSWFMFRNIQSFASNETGFNVTNCRASKENCQAVWAACNNECNQLPADQECGYGCTHDIQYPCQVRNEIACEQEFVAQLRTKASELESQYKPQAGCGSFEYFVDGKCQHIFDLCGRDSLIKYEDGQCVCPDSYIYKNKECVHEDDITPPLIDTPTLDDSTYQFCLPSMNSLSYEKEKNNFGIPVAYAQINSNYSVITHIEGEVLVMVKGAPRWAPAYKGQRIGVGDKIKTGKTGKAEVKFANSAVFKMRHTSQLEIPDQKKNDCNIELKEGYLNMYFGRVWSENDHSKIKIITQNAIAGGGSDTMLRPLQGKVDNNKKIVYELLNIPTVFAEGGNINLHAEYNSTTQISKFYVEEGQVDIFDINESISVPLSSGEQIVIELNNLPKPEDIIPASQVVEQWWKTGNDSPDFIYYISIGIFIIGLGIIIFTWKRLAGKNIIIKIIVTIGLIVLTLIIVGFLNSR